MQPLSLRQKCEALAWLRRFKGRTQYVQDFSNDMDVKLPVEKADPDASGYRRIVSCYDTKFKKGKQSITSALRLLLQRNWCGWVDKDGRLWSLDELVTGWCETAVRNGDVSQGFRCRACRLLDITTDRLFYATPLAWRCREISLLG